MQQGIKIDMHEKVFPSRMRATTGYESKYAIKKVADTVLFTTLPLELKYCNIYSLT
jgi:hypothetical protein